MSPVMALAPAAVHVLIEHSNFSPDLLWAIDCVDLFWPILAFDSCE